MITITEFILFGSTMAAIAWGLHWRAEAHKTSSLLRLMLTDKSARETILSNFEEFKRRLS